MKRLFIGLISIFFILQLFGCEKSAVEEKEKPVEFDISKHIVEVDEGENTSLTLTFVGDVMLHMPVVNAHFNNETGEYDFSPIFEYVKDINETADISVANLETVINPNAGLSGFPLFNSPKEIIKGLKEGGFNLIGTANNHSYDQGFSGVSATIETIENEDLTHMGTNLSIEENRTRIIELNNIKIGFLCYTYGLNGLIAKEDYHVNIFDEEKIIEDTNYLKTQNVDKIILFVHWGVEYKSEPTETMRIMAKIAFESGVDYIIGSHPHVVSQIEYLDDEKDRFVAFSLGNHISNQRTEFIHRSGTEDGLILKVRLEKDYYTKEVKLSSLEPISTWVYRYHDGKWHYKVVPIDKALKGVFESLQLTDNLRNKLIESKERTENILNR